MTELWENIRLRENWCDTVKTATKTENILAKASAVVYNTEKSPVFTKGETCMEAYSVQTLRSIILDSQHLLTKSAASFEYFNKKRMKWPLSILVGNRFVGYLDCKMDWKTNRMIVKKRNIFDSAFQNHPATMSAIEELALFHDAKEIVELQKK